MIGKLLDYVKRQILLTQELQETQAEVKDLRRGLRRLETTVDRLATALEHLQQTERLEREKLTLHVQNILLQFENRLPASK